MKTLEVRMWIKYYNNNTLNTLQIQNAYLEMITMSLQIKKLKLSISKIAQLKDKKQIKASIAKL